MIELISVFKKLGVKSGYRPVFGLCHVKDSSEIIVYSEGGQGKERTTGEFNEHMAEKAPTIWSALPFKPAVADLEGCPVTCLRHWRISWSKVAF